MPIDLETSIIPSDFQLEVLSYVVRDKEVMSRFVEVITESHFENPTHRIIYTLSRRYFLEFLRMCPRNTIERELGIWLQENEGRTIVPAEFFWRDLEKLFQVSLVEREYLIRRVQSYILKSQVASLGEQAIRAAQGPGDVNLDLVIREINRLFGSISGRITEKMEFLLADANQRERDNPAVRKVPTGLRTLDSSLGGGLGKGELGVVIAPTGVGKSFFLITIGANCLKFQKKVLHITLELARDKVISRYEAFMTKIVKSDLHMHSNRIVRRLHRIRQLVNPADVLVIEYPSRGLSVDELRAVLTQVKIGRSFEPDLLVIDYADILKPILTRREEARWEQHAVVYESLRGLAQEFELPIWTGSQTTAGALYKEVVTISDIAESFAKVRIADVVLAICRTSLERSLGKGRFFLDKVRDYPGNVTIPFKEDFDTSRFWEDASAQAMREIARTNVEFTEGSGESSEEGG